MEHATSQPGTMFGLSLEQLNSWANAAYLISVGVAAVASVLIFMLSSRIGAEKDRSLAEYQAKADAEISQAQGAAAAAEERAAQAHKTAALLESETEKARLETEKLKSTIAWRTISKTNADQLRNALSQQPGSVNLRYMDGDPEALYFATQLARILRDAGWNVAPGARKPGNSIPFGVWIPEPGPLRLAFAIAKHPATFQPLPEDGLEFNVQMIAGAPFLFVGPRLPPAFD